MFAEITTDPVIVRPYITGTATPALDVLIIIEPRFIIFILDLFKKLEFFLVNGMQIIIILHFFNKLFKLRYFVESLLILLS